MSWYSARGGISRVLVTDSPTELAADLAAYTAAGVTRLVFSVAAGDWFRQTELLAEAASLGTPR